MYVNMNDQTQRQTVSMGVDRRAAFGQIAGAAAVVAGVPSVAFADGAVSTATIQRSRGIYGSRIAALDAAAKSGDFAAVAAEKNAFILFNSGAYPKDAARKSAAIEGTNAIFAAIRGKDKAALASAYKSYTDNCGINTLPTIDERGGNGQGYSNDYDYKARTSAGAIYVR
uniref:Photosystem II Psb31 protein domain-containing protein n=1 Tax=Corethron hystrix TaxID=216773 RepID=A0A7S1B5M7_9STRA|mmetsp:Transcript_1392/g.2881  ORF Transcript_1392/g.2881 Transcript_1392/m.2881 type:complete len:170 (+) Transcript_1392:584-1093(+)